MLRLKLQITKLQADGASVQSTADITVDPSSTIRASLLPYVPELMSSTHSIRVIYRGQPLQVLQSWEASFRNGPTEGSVLLVYVRPSSLMRSESDLRPRRCRESALATCNILRVRRTTLAGRPHAIVMGLAALSTLTIWLYAKRLDPHFSAMLYIALGVGLSAVAIRFIQNVL